MDSIMIKNGAGICISEADMERANLSERDRLELHLLDQVAVVIPGEMTALELLRTVDALNEFSATISSVLGGACIPCDNCKSAKACDLMAGDMDSAVLNVEENGHDLTDIPSSWLEVIRESGICLRDLEEKVVAEEIIYTGLKKTEE